VIDIGLCATPMLYFSVYHLCIDGGVMVTGSHNPPEFNGFKICIGKETIYGDEIQLLRNIMEARKYKTGNGKTTTQSVADAYMAHLCSSVQIREGIKVVVDAGNGVGGMFAVPLLKAFGCKVKEIYCEPDGNFPNHFPDPTVEENIQDLIKEVKKENASLGIAFDGDADRIGVVTDEGNIIWGDLLLLLFARFIVKDNPGATIIGEVKCSQKLYDDIAKNGGNGIMWKAGHSLIKGKMKETKALLAGEMSGHMFFADRYFGYDDAIYASLRLLEIISLSQKKLSDLLSDVPKSFVTPEIRIDCPDEIKFQVVAEAKKRLSAKYPIIDIDGVRAILDNGWGLLRASNTQPVLVLRFEAVSSEALQNIRNEFESIVKAILNDYGTLLNGKDR
ncbi:MAG: phosphomannomutase/phosphoglucomutase, partial [Deltaproteobacteria bacterium]